MQRRAFLGAIAGTASSMAGGRGSDFPIIDAHVHLYDPTRPQGVPWPHESQTSLYRPYLPADHRRTVSPLNVVGMIKVECSPWVEDNYWVLDVAAWDTFVVGVVGNLHPGRPDFLEHFPKLQKNPLFRGIRFGYLWKRVVADELLRPEFISDLKALAGAGLALDTVGQAQILTDVVRITDKVPGLRVIIDHLPNVQAPAETAARAAYDSALREIAKRPQVYAKVSEVFQRVDENGRRVKIGGRILRELSFYRACLDSIYEVFGSDRLIFGSDWTNSEPMGTFAQTVGLVHEYFNNKGQEAVEKYFWRNSIAAYRWVRRQPNQPQV